MVDNPILNLNPRLFRVIFNLKARPFRVILTIVESELGSGSSAPLSNIHTLGILCYVTFLTILHPPGLPRERISSQIPWVCPPPSLGINTDKCITSTPCPTQALDYASCPERRVFDLLRSLGSLNSIHCGTFLSGGI